MTASKYMWLSIALVVASTGVTRAINHALHSNEIPHVTMVDPKHSIQSIDRSPTASIKK